MKIAKTLIMEKEIADRIKELADRERRSFVREAQVLLEAALEHLGYGNPASGQSGKTA